jgi:hypothetical protein
MHTESIKLILLNFTTSNYNMPFSCLILFNDVVRVLWSCVEYRNVPLRHLTVHSFGSAERIQVGDLQGTLRQLTYVCIVISIFWVGHGVQGFG